MSHEISCNNTIIGFNKGNGLFSSVNGITKFITNIIMNNNICYVSIIQLYLSVFNIYGSCKIFGNNIKYISKRDQESYFLFQDYSALSVIENIMFRTLSTSVYDSEWQQEEICYFQFKSNKGNLDNVVKEKTLYH